MKYQRPAYKDPAIKMFVKPASMFGGGAQDVPTPDYPIPNRENFRRAARRDRPAWVPNATTDIESEMVANLTGWGENDWTRPERYDWVDQFGVWWTFVPEAGGPMLKQGVPAMVDDIADWKSLVKFPSLADYNIKERCAELLTRHDPEKVLQVNVGLGCTERLVALMGGYEDAMVAMAMEPETVREFLEAFVDCEIELVSELCKYLPLDFVTYHDDWGTERDTFFGEQMMETIVFPPTKRFFDFLHSRDIVVQQHSCGKITRFMPYLVKLGVDFLQIQERANDFKAYKRDFGGQVGLEVMAMPARSKDESIANIRKLVDTYAAGGGLLTSTMAFDPEASWDAIFELFCYSREFYGNA
ncbi:MAG: hypothetical protein LBC65_00890 [Oscillospiraceae bacterium]|jgi:hypothetical protein|nr:hypothetical protein [Oscillospiraceae bacterium]